MPTTNAEALYGGIGKTGTGRGTGIRLLVEKSGVGNGRHGS